MKHDMSKLVGDYILLRDFKADVAARHKDEMEQITRRMKKIEERLRSGMEAVGAESLRTESGLCHKSVKLSARVEDRDAYMQFVRETGAWEFLESKANKTAVEEYLDKHGVLPPGVSVFRIESIRVVR